MSKKFTVEEIVHILNGILNGQSSKNFKLNLKDINKIDMASGLHSSFGDLHLVERFKMECWKSEPNKSPLLWSDEFNNLITTQGANRILTLGFVSGVTTPLWYTGLVQVQQTNTTGAITASTNALTFTSPTSPIFVVGQQVRVIGAGAAGADLVTTIATVTSTTSYTVANNAGTTVSSATVIAGPVFSVTDTIASHSGWNELTSFSAPSTRPAWTPGSVSGGSVDNSASPASYTMSGATSYIGGAFLVDNNTIGGTTVNLYGEGYLTAGPQPYVSGNTITLTITITQS